MCSRIVIFCSTQLELFESVALTAALQSSGAPVTLFASAECAADIAIYNTVSWATGFQATRVRSLASAQITGIARLLLEERPSAVVIPGAFESPKGLAFVCSVTAERMGISTIGVSPNDAGRLMRENLAAALLDARGRTTTWPESEEDYILAEFSDRGAWSGLLAKVRLKTMLDEVECHT